MRKDFFYCMVKGKEKSGSTLLHGEGSMATDLDSLGLQNLGYMVRWYRSFCVYREFKQAKGSTFNRIYGKASAASLELFGSVGINVFHSWVFCLLGHMTRASSELLVIPSQSEYP